MRNTVVKPAFLVSLVAAAALLGLAPRPVQAHCDTLDGPVVRDARAALEAGDVSPVLKWVEPGHEDEIRRAFAETRQVRGLGPDARALADRFFFETLVRVHREGEGAPYTGLKPAGTEVDPAVLASEAALHTGDVAHLVEWITLQVDRGLRERHARALKTRAHATEGIEQGREYVAAYVDLLHYAEALWEFAGRSPGTPGDPHGH